MKFKPILAFVFGIIFTSCASAMPILKEKNNQVAAVAETEEITIRQIADFLLTKEEHYPISDEFIERYQQKGDGYISYAKQLGMVVDKKLHEPNQKWHFFESWLYREIDEGGITWEASAKSRVYSKLYCPELVLWIYEACGVNPLKVYEAKQVAEFGKVNGDVVSTIAANMRKIVAWEDLEVNILNFLNDTNNVYNVTVEASSGYTISGLNSEYNYSSNVTFSVNVTDDNKVVDSVKMNGTELTPVNGEYSFTMPASDVVITVILKDIKPATGVTLNPTSLDLMVGDKNKLIVATPIPSDTTDAATWSVIEGEENISITNSGNEVTVKALKEGVSKVKVSYNENVSSECIITISKREIVTEPGSIAKYDIKYDLGGKTRAKELTSVTDIFNTFELISDGESIINSVTSATKIYGGGNGGSGENVWYSGNMLKFGTQSVMGDLTLELACEVNRVVITGYTHATSASIRAGASDSLDWTNGTDSTETIVYSCKDMSVASKTVIGNQETTSITLDFDYTNSFRIATIKAMPIYITSIEFIVNVD